MHKQIKERKEKKKNKTKLWKLCTLKKKHIQYLHIARGLLDLKKPLLRTVTNVLSSYYLQHVEGEKKGSLQGQQGIHSYFPCLHHLGMECTRKGTIGKWQDQPLACQRIHSFWCVDPP